jgi:hypothetical protein
MNSYALLVAILLSQAPVLMGEEPAKPDSSTTPTAAELFSRRILPIFKSPNPSSCTQCHLAGVQLKNYILPSHEKTFLSLRDQGLIDLDKPESSKILALIQMGKDAQNQSPIDEKMRMAEYAAFREWIIASCSDQALRGAPKLNPDALATPKRVAEIIRHARTDKVLESFERNIWGQRFRCTGCHLAGGSEVERLKKEQGDEDFLWMRPTAPETMKHLIEAKLINLTQPERSLLLRKPTNQIEHGGGKKMAVGDLGYKLFRSWIEDYARTVNDGYKNPAELPAEDVMGYFPTEIWIRLNNTPAPWADRLVVIELYAFDTATNAWEKSPIASSDRPLHPNGGPWQHVLILLAKRGSERAANWNDVAKRTLPTGRYLMKVYVDGAKRLEKDWTKQLDERDYFGELETQSQWPIGYGSMSNFDVSAFKKKSR